MSWRPVTDIDASFDRLRQLKEQMKGHNDAAEARLKASEDRVAKLLKENAELRKKLQQDKMSRCTDPKTGQCIRGDRCCKDCPDANKWDCHWVCPQAEQECEWRDDDDKGGS